MIPFNEFNDNLLNVKKEIIENKEGLTHLYSVIINEADINHIDFDLINLDDIFTARETIFEVVSEEDDYGDIRIDPHHLFTRVYSIQHKMHELETTPKQRVPSSYRFL